MTAGDNDGWKKGAGIISSSMGEELTPHRWRRSSMLDAESPFAMLVRNLASNSPAQSVHQPLL
jgi:hypothetical protein